MTSAPRLVLLAPALMVLGLCWSVHANQQDTALPPGFVTRYITPQANLSVDQLVGRWYVAEQVVPATPYNRSAAVCLIFDFHYNDNDTLVVENILVLGQVPFAPEPAAPVQDNGVWDIIRHGVPAFSYAVVELSADNRYLAVGSCLNAKKKTCEGLVLVRQIADAENNDRLSELHSSLIRAGADGATRGFVSIIQYCGLGTTPSPDVNA